MANGPLTVHTAAITTVSVEIKTLTVSGKQVTLSVFRQLQEQALILRDGTFAGQPWGVVNYHPDKCSGGREHWHVVWQNGSELRRSGVLKSPIFEPFECDEGDRFVTSCAHDFLLTGETGYFGGQPPLEAIVNNDAGLVYSQTEHGFATRLSLTNLGYAAVHTFLQVETDKQRRKRYGHPGEIPPDSPAGKVVERLDGQLLALAEEVATFDATTDQLYAAYTKALEREQVVRARHATARQTLAELPQLFIAV